VSLAGGRVLKKAFERRLGPDNLDSQGRLRLQLSGVIDQKTRTPPGVMRPRAGAVEQDGAERVFVKPAI
jgi:hypothetical protein